MSTAEERQAWRELASRLAFYGLEGKAQDAIWALVADVDALTAERDALAAELATVRAQLARFDEIERYYQDRNNVLAETGNKRNSWQQP